nr:TPA_asm: hypothetical protein HUJ06_014882 [Nelumbo nucifera]
MATPRKRARTLETPANRKQVNNEEIQTPRANEVSGYEQFRDQRIKENMQRMQKLGIIDLSLKLKAELPPKRTPRNLSERKTPQRSPLPSSEPPRRSSRLQNVTPVSYTELRVPRKEKLEKDEEPRIGEGSKPEIYTEEHDKLLGTCETSWTLFVDGYGKDGKRVYDPVKGKTCHQCRQKTLGLRTHCSKCNLVQGQFCGDCLYMRYGENVIEANQNPNWICPVCRGICNCSLCRLAKGWIPTGSLYRKVSRLGFKSVAHYLIQTRRSQQNSNDNNSSSEHQVSAKRSIAFGDTEELNNLNNHKESPDSDDGPHECSNPQPEDKSDGRKGEKNEFTGLACKHDTDNVTSENNSETAIISKLGPYSIAGNFKQGLNNDGSYDDGSSNLMFEDNRIAGELKGDKEDHSLESLDDGISNISGNVKQGLSKDGSHDDGSSDTMFEDNKGADEFKGDKEDHNLENISNITGNVKQELSNNRSHDDGISDSVFRENKGADDFEGNKEDHNLDSISHIAAETHPTPKRKSAFAAELIPDSIAGRLRQRRNKS